MSSLWLLCVVTGSLLHGSTALRQVADKQNSSALTVQRGGTLSNEAPSVLQQQQSDTKTKQCQGQCTIDVSYDRKFVGQFTFGPETTLLDLRVFTQKHINPDADKKLARKIQQHFRLVNNRWKSDGVSDDASLTDLGFGHGDVVNAYPLGGLMGGVTFGEEGADPHDYDFTANLDVSTNQGAYQCSGTIFGKWVLTAKHCVEYPGRVNVGVTVYPPGEAQRKFKAGVFALHPSLDMALLELQSDTIGSIPRTGARSCKSIGVEKCVDIYMSFKMPGGWARHSGEVQVFDAAGTEIRLGDGYVPPEHRYPITIRQAPPSYVPTARFVLDQGKPAANTMVKLGGYGTQENGTLGEFGLGTLRLTWHALCASEGRAKAGGSYFKPQASMGGDSGGSWWHDETEDGETVHHVFAVHKAGTAIDVSRLHTPAEMQKLRMKDSWMTFIAGSEVPPLPGGLSPGFTLSDKFPMGMPVDPAPDCP